MMITYTGLTPKSQIARAETNGIQQFVSEIFVLLAKLNVGAAINATTAGRMPRNIAATIVLSSNCLKNIAISRMSRNEGKVVAKLVHNAPRSRRSL